MARGSIYPADSRAGRQGLAWLIMYRVNGRQVSKVVHGRRRDAEKALTERQQQANAGMHADLDANKTTVAQFIDRWLAQATLHLAPQSLLQYRGVLARMSALLGHHKLARLGSVHVQAAVSALEGSDSYVRYHHTVLRRVLQQAVKWGWLPRNPADNVSLPPRSEHEARALTAEEAIRLLAATRADPAGILVILALGLALRRGEALGLQWGDIDWERKLAHIRRSVQQCNREYKMPKSGKGRMVSVPQFVLIALRDEQTKWERQREAFGEEWNPDGLVYCPPSGRAVAFGTTPLMRRLCKCAGIDPPVCFHALRHTHSTLLLAGGADVKAVSQRLGHSNVQITLSVYHHILAGADGQNAEQIDRKLKA